MRESRSGVQVLIRPVATEHNSAERAAPLCPLGVAMMLQTPNTTDMERSDRHSKIAFLRCLGEYLGVAAWTVISS